LFKWITQHLRIKKFLGNSENAVKTQVWCAVATYVLIAIVKKELQVDASLYTCLQILSVSVFEKTEVSCALQADAYQTDLPDIANPHISRIGHWLVFRAARGSFSGSSCSSAAIRCPAG